MGNPERQVFVNTFDFFAQDSWQLSPKLNLNYGLRWDYEGPLHNSWKNLSVFRPNLGGVVFQGNQISYAVRPYLHQLQSSRWIVYQATPPHVVRAGVGLYYDTPNLNPFLDNRPGNDAPNGVEGNPGGPDTVTTATAGGYTIVNGRQRLSSGPGLQQYFFHRQELCPVAQFEFQLAA